MYFKRYIDKIKTNRQYLKRGSVLDPLTHRSYDTTKRIALLKARADYERELHDLKNKYFGK